MLVRDPTCLHAVQHLVQHVAYIQHVEQHSTATCSIYNMYRYKMYMRAHVIWIHMVLPWHVLGCVPHKARKMCIREMHRDAQRCTEMHGDAQRCTEMHGDARRCTEMHRDARRCTEMHGDARRCTEMHGDAQRCTEMHRDAQR